MTKLNTIRSALANLKNRRQRVRWGAAACGLAIAVLCVLAGALALDWTFKMSVAQRFVALALYIAALVWAYRRWVRPWLGHRETEIDMALLVEKHQRIDSELVAALQFETPEAERWGSRQLETAVIDYVAEFGQNWNFLEGVPTEPLKRRGAILAVLLVAAIAWGAVYHRHAAAFLQRLFLADAKYPSTTEIKQIVVIGGETVLPPREDGYRGPYGKPITFEVQATGVLPDEGQIQVGTLAGETWEPLFLHKTTRTVAGDADVAIYEAKLPRLLESIHFQAVLNDDSTKQYPLTVIALPVVQAKLTATPPSYAQGAEKDDPPGGSRQLSVLEGSRVDLQVSCANKKLKSAAVRIVPAASVAAAGDATKPKTEEPSDPAKDLYPLTRTIDNNKNSNADAAETWQLAGTASPFARVTADLRYEVVVSDADDMTPEHPVQGSIRIRPDQKPSITGDAITLYVLPTGTPRITYNAQDDFAVNGVKLHLEVVRENVPGGAAPPTADGERNKPIEPLVLRQPGEPVLRAQLPLKGEFALSLAPYHLAKGDQLKVILEAVDFRGERVPGESGFSEPLVFHVTDESGIYAVTSESDERGARNIDNINKLQLGIGGSK